MPKIAATAAELAVLTWEPWDRPKSDEIDISERAFQKMGETVRRARTLMCLTKENLTILSASVDTNVTLAGAENFDDVAACLRQLAEMTEAAGLRQRCAVEAAKSLRPN